ncbi:hypothetical protein PO124_24195 [Bacillus licheniformis]|nr:hypothetical protein [Bacillus licheniformis]
MNLEHPMVTRIRTHGYPKEADREQMRSHGGLAGYPKEEAWVNCDFLQLRPV